MSGLAGQTSLFPPEPAPDPLLCWLWLAHVLGPASVHAGRVLDAFGGAQEAWEARDTAEFRLAAGEAAALRAQQLAPEQYHPLVMRCDDLGVRILPFDDPDYPLAFSRIPDMPLVLYCTGDDGLDSAGHRAAVKNNCPTIAVMGVPIDRTYPAANVVLRHKIEQKGCVISEYPPRSEGVGPNGFLQRNRLIAALSSALLVVEAQEKSGTMSTVSHAERYGKPVFAVPGSIYSPNSAGTNGLLRDGRARAVCSAADLLGPLGLHRQSAAAVTAKQPEPLSENERKVLSCIGPQPLGIEELCVRSGLPTAVLLGTLMKLELSGRVLCMPGKRYVIK